MKEIRSAEKLTETKHDGATLTVMSKQSSSEMIHTEGRHDSEGDIHVQDDQQQSDSDMSGSQDDDDDQELQIFFEKDEINNANQNQKKDLFEELLNMKKTATMQEAGKNKINIMDFMPTHEQ